VLRRKATEDGALDKSVTSDDIAEAIGKQMQIEIVPDLLDLGGEPLAAIGEYQLPLKLLLPGGERGMVDVTIVAT
jgi:ribosomal protein L9